MDLTLTIHRIKHCVKETFEVSEIIRTSISDIVKLMIDRYPGTSADEIKNAMADIEGWVMPARPQKDLIEITPRFFS